MKRLPGNNPQTTTPNISAHDEKILNRAKSLMVIIDNKNCNRREKIVLLLKFVDGIWDPDTKLLSGTSPLKINSVIDEYSRILNSSRSTKNKIEFRSIVFNALAQEVLGEHYDDYVSFQNSRTPKPLRALEVELRDWLLAKLAATRSPTVQSKTKSDQVLPASNSGSTNDTGNRIPQPNIPDETLGAIEEILRQSSDDSTSTFSEPSVHPSSQHGSQGAQTFQSQPQPLNSNPSTSPFHQTLSATAATPRSNQPFGANHTQYPTTPSPYPTTASQPPASGMSSSEPQFHSPQTTREPLPTHNSYSASTGSVKDAMLSNPGTQKVSEAWNLIAQCGFNHDGYLILLQYLVTGEIPANLYTESQRQFLQQFSAFTQSITNLRNTVNISEQRLWSDKLALKIVHQVYGLSAREALAEQIDRNGIHRGEIARWIPTNLRQE